MLSRPPRSMASTLQQSEIRQHNARAMFFILILRLSHRETKQSNASSGNCSRVWTTMSAGNEACEESTPTTRMPARCAPSIPAGESSTTTQRVGGDETLAAATRKTSGLGLPVSTSSADTIASKKSASFNAPSIASLLSTDAEVASAWEKLNALIPNQISKPRLFDGTNAFDLTQGKFFTEVRAEGRVISPAKRFRKSLASQLEPFCCKDLSPRKPVIIGGIQ